MFVDTHTHLYADAFNPDRAALIRKAINLGVQRFYMPNIDPDSVQGMLEVCAQFPDHCFPMMGLHPCSVNEGAETLIEQVKTELQTGKYKAVGEIGIDLHWDKTHRAMQEKVFLMQVEMALEHDLPVVIHTRESFEVVYGLLKSLKSIPKGIFHCFTGTLEQAEQVIALGGFKLGIGGVLTFKNSGLDQVLKSVDLEHLVLETDAPYLAPVPHRGKRNEPAYIMEVARKLAEVKNVGLHEVEEVTTRNALELFGA